MCEIRNECDNIMIQNIFNVQLNKTYNIDEFKQVQNSYKSNFK